MFRIKKGIIIYYKKFLKNNLVMPTKSLSSDARAHIIKLRHSGASCISDHPLVIAPGGATAAGAKALHCRSLKRALRKIF